MALAVAVVERLDDRLDAREPVGPAVVLAGDPELLEAAQHDVVAAVGEPLDVRDDARAADRVDRRPPLVVALPPGPQQHHADHAIAVERVGHHLAVARLEDVQRQETRWGRGRRSAAGRDRRIGMRGEHRRQWQSNRQLAQ